MPVCVPRSVRMLLPALALASALILWSGSAFVHASGNEDRVTVAINGEAVPLESPAKLIDGRIFIPLRGVLERLGIQVDYLHDDQVVRLQRMDTDVRLPLGAAEAIVDGDTVELDAPAIVEDGRTLVPLRFVSQVFGFEIRWDQETATAQIETRHLRRVRETNASEEQAEASAPEPRIPFTEEDLDLLARLIQAEAGSEPFEGKIAVGAVVINRVLHPKFPSTIYDVIHQPGQFAVVKSGKIRRAASADARDAAWRALHGEDPSNGSIYFFSPALSSRSVWFTPVVEIHSHLFGR